MIAKFSPKEVREYEDSLKSYRDLKNSIDTAREEGREEGMEKGIEVGMEKGAKKTNSTIVLNMHSKGYSIESIAEITELPIAIVKKIIEDNDR